MPEDNARTSVVQGNEEGLPDVIETTDPGELAPVEGLSYDKAKELWGDDLQRLPKHYQTILHDLCQDISMREMWPRLDETYRAAIQRFYAIDEFDHVYNADDDCWDKVPYNGQLNSNGQDDDVDHVISSYPFNIYKAFKRGFVQTVAASIPGTKFVAADSADTRDIDAASEAENFKKIIEQQNDMTTQVQDHANLFFTDGKLCIYNRTVLDGPTFGWYDEEGVDEEPEGLQDEGEPQPKKPRRPKAGAMSTAYGSLEVKTPVNMTKKSDFQWLQLSLEVDEDEGKAVYPFMADEIQSGSTGPGEVLRDRTIRLAVKQGTRGMAESADSMADLVTWQRTWLRPGKFLKLAKPDRKFLMAVFPDGCFVAFMGDTYCESRNESMDDHWVVKWPESGTGSTRRSIGQPLVPVQDAFIDVTDLKMNCYMNLVPTVLIDETLLEGSALSQQRAEYGTFVPVTMPDSEGGQPSPLAEHVFVVTVPTIPADLQQFSMDLMTDIPSFLTGLFAAALGGSDPNNETAAGIQVLGAKSRGQQIPYYKQLANAYAESMEQLVKIAAKSYPDDEPIKMPAQDGKTTIQVALDALKGGKFVCYPEIGETIPESFDEKAARVQEWLSDSETNPAIAAILNDPVNQTTLNKFLGTTEFKLPAQDSREFQLRIIGMLLEEVPLPSPQKIQHMQRSKQAFDMGVQGGLEPEEAKQSLAPFDPSMGPENVTSWPAPADRIAQLLFKNQDHALAIKTTQDWITSDKGWEASQESPDGFENVCLNLELHQQATQQAQDQQVKTAATVLAGQEGIKADAKASGAVKAEKGKALVKKETNEDVGINFRDLGPAARAQILMKRGINPTPDAIEEANEAASNPEGTPEAPDEPEIEK